MTRQRSVALAVALSLSLVLGACGDDALPDRGDVPDNTEEEAADFTVVLTADAIDMPDEVTGGVVHVALESEIDDAEINFTKVAPGTTEDQMKQAISGVVAGGPIPDFIEETTGILGAAEGGGGESTLILPEGDYIAWWIPEDPRSEEAEAGAPEGESPEGPPPAGEEQPEGGEGGPGGGGPPPEAVATKRFTVAPGEPADLPELDGNEIVARDYTFDVNVKAGAQDFVFRNEGPGQFHHVVLFNFGDLEASVVEENLASFLEGGEEAPPPPAFEGVDFENMEAGDGAVLSPGLGATATAKGFESGSTYAAVCFIGDRSGGPPHAFAHGMRTVFTVE